MLYQTDSESIKKASIEDLQELLAESKYCLYGILLEAKKTLNPTYLGQIYEIEDQKVVDSYHSLIHRLEGEICLRSGRLPNPYGMVSYSRGKVVNSYSAKYYNRKSR